MTVDTLDDVRARDVAEVLGLLAPGAEIEISPSQSALLDRLVSAGLLVAVADATDARARLATKKEALGALPAGDPGIGGLRAEILDLSEKLSTLDGAAFVRVGGDVGPYRGSAPEKRRGLALTHAGRTLLSHLGPRASRAPDVTVADFGKQLDALEALFAMRAKRAADLVQRVRSRIATIEPHTLRSAMLGLASLSHPVDALGDAFLVLFSALRQARPGDGYTVAQDAAAAESILLHSGQTSVAYDGQIPSALVAWRSDLAQRYCQGRTEDALDAMLLLAAVPPADREARIERAARFASAMAKASVPTPLSLALLATAGGETPELALSTVAAFRAVHTPDPLDALTVAVLAAMQRGFSLETQLGRIQKIHAHLARLAPSGMWVAAALLALLDGDEAGVLEDLRLASRQVQQRGLAPGGSEATSLGLKLLLQTALLARGDEGDPEESLALALRALSDVGALDLGTQGLGTVSATLPLLSGTVAAFHRPMLDAAVLYEQHAAPMHSDYVFGGGHHRSFGWG